MATQAPPKLPPELLAQILASSNVSDVGGNGVQRSYTDPATGMQYFGSMQNYGTVGTGESSYVDRNTLEPIRTISRDVPNRTGGSYSGYENFDLDGNYLGYGEHKANWKDMIQAMMMVAPAVGGIYGAASSGALGGTSAATNAAGSTGMTLAEQAAFLEANAGALAPGAEIAAGYGNTWGVGADGILGQGATMLADGSPVDPWKLDPDPTNYGNEGNRIPNSNQGGPNAPSTPNGAPNGGNNPPPAKTGGPGYTVRDGMQLASAGLRVAGSLSGNGGGDVSDPDQRLIDAQLRSMDTQEALMQRMISNADMILPFQRESLDFGLKTAKEAYGDYRADRTYALSRRDQLTGLQDKMLADVRNFDTEAKREELAGKAIADVNQGFSSALNQTARSMSRRGMNPNDGRWGSAVRQLVADKTLAQAAAANNARADARKEGYALTDRAAGALAQSPGLALQSTAAGQGAGAQPIGMTGATAQSIQSGLAPAAQLAGQWGNNATSMYNAQQRSGGGSGPDWGGYGALLAGAAKAWDAFGG